jgi:hypothetical protein
MGVDPASFFPENHNIPIVKTFGTDCGLFVHSGNISIFYTTLGVSVFEYPKGGKNAYFCSIVDNKVAFYMLLCFILNDKSVQRLNN